MAFYKTCPDCGAHLDPGERCNCNKEAPRLLQQPGAHSDQTTPVTSSITNLPPTGNPERSLLATIYQRSICDMVNEITNPNTLRQAYTIIEGLCQREEKRHA